MNPSISSLASAIRDRTTLPRFTDELSIEDAYTMQKQLVAEVSNGPVAGLKAGVTAEAAQQVFGINEPLIGSLYAWGRLVSGTTMSFVPGLKLECEMGVVVDEDGNPTSAGPVIEVPRMAWGDPSDAKGTNLAACNIAAESYIVGEFGELRDSYDDLGVTLTRDGELVCEASLTEALGGPQPAVEWMNSEAARRGIETRAGMLYITGACGGIQDAEKGSYVADYGPLGTIAFTVS